MLNHGNIATASSPDIATLTVKDFEPHLDAVFEMNSPAGTVPLKLAKTECYGQAIREGGAFSLLFVAPVGPWLPQSIYPVRHPAPWKFSRCRSGRCRAATAPGRTLDRLMASLPPEKGVADR